MRRGVFVGFASVLLFAGSPSLWLSTAAPVAGAEHVWGGQGMSLSPSSATQSPVESPLSPPVSTEPPAPTPSASPQTQLFPGASLTWTMGDVSPFPDADASDPLIPWRDGFAAGGAVGTGDGLDGAVWLSDASGAWTRVQDPLFADSTIMWMSGSDDVLIAFGPVGAGITDTQEWLSTDGMSWSSVALPSVFSNALITGVEHGPAGFLLSAVTEDGPRAITALSPDGRNWVLGRSWTGGRAARGPVGPLDAAERIQVSVSSLGYLAWLPLHQRPSWLSSDGLHWRPLSGTNADDIEFVQSAADGYIASIGPKRHCRIWECGGDGTIFSPSYRQSADGAHWTDLTRQQLPKGPAYGPTALLSNGQTFLVVDHRGRAWSSTDGLDWQPDPVYVPDAATLTASGSLHFDSMALGLSGLADMEYDGQTTTTPWLATFSAAPATSALPFSTRYPVPR